MVKAIFFDIDGTLVSFKTHTVSSQVLETLHKVRKRGIKLFLATGRHRSAIGAAADRFPFDGYITLNGQYCFAGGQVLRSNPIPPDSAAHISRILEHSGIPAILLEETDTYTVNPGPRARLFPEQLNIPLPSVSPVSCLLDRTLYQAVVFLTREEEQHMGAPFSDLEVMRWHPDFVDIIASGGGKDRGMDAILSYFGIDLADTMAFGDGENDLPMLRHAALGVAMGNADDTVKAQADFVTGTVDEDGIVSALNRFVL